MKKVFWWTLGILLSPVLLFIILTVLLYLPPVQNWVVDKAAAIASEKLGMEITIDHVNLEFPLDLGIDGFRAIKPDSVYPQRRDTVADVEHMVVDVQLWPLFSSKVVINELEISNVRLDTDGLIEAARVKGRFGRLALASRGIDLDQQTVDVNGARLEDAMFDIALADSVPEDTTTTEPVRWKIYADSLVIARTDVVLHMPGDTLNVQAYMGKAVARTGVVDLENEAYSVSSLDWTDGRLTYDNRFEPQVEGFDYNHIDLSDISLGIDSIYYYAPDTRANIRYARMKDKSGLEVKQLSGPVSLDDTSLHLPQLRMRTGDSDLDLELDLDMNTFDELDPGQMRVRLNAQLGKQDLLKFMGDLPQQMQQRWPNHPLSVVGSVNGNMESLGFTGLELSLPTAFHATAHGTAENLADTEHLQADVTFEAQTYDLGFVTALLPRDVQRNYRIPRMTASGRVKADGPRYALDVTLLEGRGVVKAKGQLDSRVMAYDATVSVQQLNVHDFMPHDSIYTVSADVVAKGRGVDFLSPKTTLTADATISQLHYGHWNLTAMTAKADVKNGRAVADVVSRNQLLNGTITLDALMSTKRVDATIATDISRADLYELRLLDSPTTMGMCAHLDVQSDLKDAYRVQGFINDLTITDTDDKRTYRPTDVTIDVLTQRDTTWAKVYSGDIELDLRASGGYEQLLSQFTALSDELSKQFDRKMIDQPALRELLPVVQMHFKSGPDNPLVSLLKTQDVTYKSVLMDMSMSPAAGVNGQGYVQSLVYDSIRLDTIRFSLKQRGEQLSFSGQVRNNRRNPQFVFNALFDGVLQERGATMGVRYYDASNKMGIRLGAQAEMLDSGLNVRLMPERPTIGFKEFSLNKDNFIFFDQNNRVRAKVDLIAADGTGLKLYSEDTDSTALQDLTVSLNKLNLAEVTSVLPYVPRMGGLLNGDYHVVQDAGGQFSVVSDMAVQGMSYEGSPIGNLSTELVYLQKEGDAHAVEARLMMDDEEFGLLSGTYYNGDEGRIDATFNMERLPLKIVNGFIPDQLFGFEGYAEGSLDIQGTTSKPQVDGEVYLDSCYLVSAPYGMNLRFDNDPVRIVGSNLLFENFTVYAHNDNPLNIMGSIDFSDLDRIMLDMRMRAQNYQIIGAKENAKSVAYGKAFVNFFGRMRGPLDNLSLRGKLDVLGTTDMSYILRDSPLTTDNQLDELVKFRDFSDTTQTVISRPELSGFNMDLTMEVSKGAHIMAYLNTDHSNYIDLMGGGTLRMTYNPAESLRMTGKYTLSNGEMKYSLPVIPLKTFTIQDGSYIEFTGEVMNPTLNITATEQVKSNVTDESGQARSVTFDCGVIITKTLSDMGLEFTLDAPQDMMLHNELQSMSVDQRGKLAVTMLTTGMYLADGNTSAFSMNSALSSFLSSEINNLTGNALRTLDLSFGMDNTTDATGASHTDYSFKFAKRFWNNRLRIVVGGKVSSGSDMTTQNNSFFDNVSAEYRLDDTANKYVTLFYQNNAYDWLDGYTQEFGGGFTWRRSLQNFWDIIRFRNDPQQQMPAPRQPVRTDSTTVRNDSTTIKQHEK